MRFSLWRDKLPDLQGFNIMDYHRYAKILDGGEDMKAIVKTPQLLEK